MTPSASLEALLFSSKSRDVAVASALIVLVCALAFIPLVLMPAIWPGNVLAATKARIEEVEAYLHDGAIGSPGVFQDLDEYARTSWVSAYYKFIVFVLALSISVWSITLPSATTAFGIWSTFVWRRVAAGPTWRVLSRKK